MRKDAMKFRIDESANYRAFFLKDSLQTVRFFIDGDKPMLPPKFPEFYDIKITDLCFSNCEYCYMDSTPKGCHATNPLSLLAKFFNGMSTNERPFQVAIGGGEPTLHPEFREILQLLHDLGITPNYTTSGNFHNIPVSQIMDATHAFCGAVAVSCHPHLERTWQRAVEMYLEIGIPVALHCMVSDAASIDAMLKIYDRWIEQISVIVLLPLHQQGRCKTAKLDEAYLLKHLPKDLSKFGYGAMMSDLVRKNNNLFKASWFPPEMFSRYLNLCDGTIRPSSFSSDIIGMI